MGPIGNRRTIPTVRPSIVANPVGDTRHKSACPLRGRTVKVKMERSTSVREALMGLPDSCAMVRANLLYAGLNSPPPAAILVAVQRRVAVAWFRMPSLRRQSRLPRAPVFPDKPARSHFRHTANVFENVVILYPLAIGKKPFVLTRSSVISDMEETSQAKTP